MPYDYDDTPDLAMGERLATALRANDPEPPLYATLRPDVQKKIDGLVRTEVQILTTLRIVGAVAALLATAALSGVAWAGASIVTIGTRLDAVERRLDTHTHGEGHPPALSEIAENSAAIRELRAETRAELASINQQLTAIREALTGEDRRGHR